jgi:hypothetical protein
MILPAPFTALSAGGLKLRGNDNFVAVPVKNEVIDGAGALPLEAEVIDSDNLMGIGISFRIEIPCALDDICPQCKKYY